MLVGNLWELLWWRVVWPTLLFEGHDGCVGGVNSKWKWAGGAPVSRSAIMTHESARLSAPCSSSKPDADGSTSAN